MKKLVKESLSKLPPIVIKDPENKSKWVCEETTEEFTEFIEEELENREDYEAFMKTHKMENPAVLKCENIPCLAGDDIFVVYFPESGDCGYTFDGYFSIRKTISFTLEDALKKILLEENPD
jgi:hypothetical protein